jgi:hypothetical protein
MELKKNTDSLIEILGTVLGFILLPVCFLLILLAIPYFIAKFIYQKHISRKYAVKFHEKYESKKFLFVCKNDDNYFKVYKDSLESIIGQHTVVINELYINNEEFKLEKSIYEQEISMINYLPALFYIEKSISRFGLYYEFKDYIKGKPKKMNRFLKKFVVTHGKELQLT